MAVSTGTIRLYTQDKEGNIVWEYTAKKQGDPHFSTFLAGMEEACGELPNELRLEGSVAELVEKYWTYYLWMYETRDVVDAIRQAYARSHHLDHSLALPTRLICEHGRVPFVDDILPVMGMLAFDNWQLYTLVYPDDTIEVDAAKHLIAVGSILYDMGVTLSDMQTIATTTWTLPSEQENVHDQCINLLIRLVRTRADNKHRETLIKVGLALLHHAHLNTSNNDGRYINLYDIPWKCVDSILRELGCYENMTEEVSRLRDIALVFSGKGNTRNVSVSLFSTTLPTQEHNTLTTNITYGVEIFTLYDSILTSIPEDVEPEVIGILGPIFYTGRVRIVRSACDEFLYRVHTMVENVALYHNSSQLSLLAMYVSLLSHVIVGNKGLELITKRLRRHLENEKRVDVKDRIIEFCRLSDKYLASQYCLNNMNSRNTVATPLTIDVAAQAVGASQLLF